MQIGYIGLIKAARRFEPERGLKFSTYAVPVIAGEIKSQLRDQGAVKMSRDLKADILTIRKAESSFIAAKGNSPRISDLAERTGLDCERVKEVLIASDRLKNIEDFESSGLWEDDEEAKIKRIDLFSGIDGLPPQHKKLILLRYYKDLTQKQAAKIMGMSQVQLCRTEKRILKQLAEKV